MLHAKIQVQLSSNTRRGRRNKEGLVRSKYRGNIELEGHRATVTALECLDGVAHACKEVGIDNVLSLQVDDATIFMDLNDHPHDIDDMLEAAQKARAIERDFDLIKMALTHEADGQRVLFHVTFPYEALRGKEPIEVVASGRVLAMQIKQGERAQEYAERLKVWSSDSQQLDHHRLKLDQMLQSLSTVFEDAFPDAIVETEPTTVRLTQPTEQKVGNFRNLSFGQGAQTPRYRNQDSTPNEPERRGRQSRNKDRSRARDRQSRPRRAREREERRPSRRRDDRRSAAPNRRRGADRSEPSRRRPQRPSAGPPRRRRDERRRSRSRVRRPYVDYYDMYYYDPYWDYASFVLLHSMLYDHHWHLPYITVFDPWGGMLGTGMYVEDFLVSDPWFGADVIGFGYDGGLHVADSIGHYDMYDDGGYGHHYGGYDSGYDDGYHADGYDDGYDDDGYDDAGYDDAGYDDGYDDDDGYHADGYDDYDDGGFDDYDDGGFDDFGGFDDGGFDDGGDW